MEILEKVIMYAVIGVIISIITKKINMDQGKLEINESNEYCIDMKIYSKIFLGLAICATLLAISISFFPSNLHGKQELMAVIGEVIVIGIFYLLSYLYSRFYVKIGLENIVIRRLVGKEKIIPYAELTDVWIDGDGNLEFYCRDKKVLTFPKTYPQDFLLEMLKINKIKAKRKVSMNEFVLVPTAINKITSYVCVIAILVIDILCIYVRHLLAIMAMTTFLIFLIFLCIAVSVEKIIVKDHVIIWNRFLRKTKLIDFSDIKYVKMTEGDQPQIYIYSEKGLEMKFSKFMDNINVFEELIVRQKWKIRK